ncbi:MAG: hypothetical protein GXO82_09985 [Chlorobi bacterium]|nr:hypothetical protein [Chlorobiota bacterium]
MRCLWIILIAVLVVAARSESIEVRNLRVINLSELGLKGRIERVRLSPDVQFASVEIRRGLSRFLYVVDLRKRKARAVDPRIDLPAYASWKRSPYRYLLTVEDGEADWYPRLVRGERWLCFTSNGTGDEKDLYLYNVDRHIIVRLTAGSERERFPRWSPDGQSLAFIRQSNKGNELQFYPDADVVFRELESLHYREPFMSALHASALTSSFDNHLVTIKKSRFPVLYYWEGNRPVAVSAMRDRVRHLDESALNWTNQAPMVLFKSADGLPSILGMRRTRPKSHKAKRNYVVRQLAFPATFIGGNSVVGRNRSGHGLAVITRIRKTPEMIPLVFQTPYEDDLDRIRSIDAMTTTVGGEGNYNLLLGFGTSEDDYIMYGKIKPEDIGESVRSKVLVNIGVSGGFARYTGDAGEGDFLPMGGLWLEVQPLPGSAPALELGLEINHVELSGRTLLNKQFSRELWTGSIYLQAGYLFMYTYRPFVRASLGRAILDKQRSDGSRQQTLIYGIGGGMEFVVTPSMQVRVYGVFQYAKKDLDMTMQIPKADSFGRIMVGLNYTLPL